MRIRDWSSDVCSSVLVALELGVQFLQEIAVGIEPRDLVLVLVGHQLVGIARDRLGEAGHALGLRRIGGAGLFDQRRVPVAICLVLVTDPAPAAAGPQNEKSAVMGTSVFRV